ncbi:MAG: hypothetical protein GZ091_16045 [Paludibacter sp.]|nr:hypothetical protein [Paludibacter sp.]
MKKLTVVQKRKIRQDRWFDHLFFAGMILFFSFAGWFAFNNYFRYDIYHERVLAKYENKQLETGKTCMFRNELKMGATIPVLIEGETFYVCCPRCAENLKLNYTDSQFAVDQYSHHRIKKSKAFIVLNNNLNGKVRYFESEENFNHFKNQK